MAHKGGMTSVSFHSRVQACARSIDSEFDFDNVIAWMLQEFGDDDTIKRTKDPYKLCRNIITMGGGGREKDLNIAAFREAFTKYLASHEKRLRDRLDDSEKRLRDTMDAGHRALDDERQANREREIEYRKTELDLRNQLQIKQQEVMDLERKNHTLEIKALQAAPSAAD